MNQKAFSIFVGVLMVLSGIAYFLPIGTNNSEIVVPSTNDSLETFQVKGSLVEWSFDGLGDVLEMAPQSTDMAYWIDINSSQNLTSAARMALPQSIGLAYGNQLYTTQIERLAEIRFNNTWAEFHWIRPYPLAYDGLVIPHDGYMMIPVGTDFAMVMGRPTLFGPQEGIKQSLDVISGGQPAEDFTLVNDSSADLQVAALGRGGRSMPLAGGYKEFNLRVTESRDGADGFDIVSRILQPTADTSSKIKDLAEKSDLVYSASGSEGELSGFVPGTNIQDVLMALLGP